MTTNPEIDQDRVFDLFDTYKKYGVVMFAEQRRIYEFIAANIEQEDDVIEAGCGNGVGSAMLSRAAWSLYATDKLESNIKFARELYPWIDFAVWDITNPLFHEPEEVVVCVEAFEHVANGEQALRNLCDKATCEVWLSTPNGIGKQRPPSNPFHVTEYTPQEMEQLIRAVRPDAMLDVYECDKFTKIGVDGTDGIDGTFSPLLYRIDVS